MQQLTSCPVCNAQSFSSYIQTKAQMHVQDVGEVFNFDQCGSCDLVFLNPRVDPEKLVDYYSDFYLPYRGSKAWGKYEKFVEGSQLKLDAARIATVNKYYTLSSSDLILDVGCGKPSFLESCIQEHACNGMGLDFSSEGWSPDTERFKNLDLVVGEIEDLPLNLAPDVITMWHYLEHDYKPLANLKALRKRAKESTTLIIEVPNFDSESRHKFGSDWAGWHTPRHTSLFSPSNMETLLNNAGWKVEAVNTYGTLDPYVLYWMSKMEKKRITWNKSMEEEFVSFVLGMIKFYPKKLMQKSRSLGVMTAIAKPL